MPLPQNAELSSTSEALTQNISTLYNTAKLEIQRKDDEIKELREKLGTSGGHRSGGGGGGGSRERSRGREGSSRR